MAITQEFRRQCAEFSNSTEVKRWVIALSGGLDSMVTLELAHRFLPKAAITAVHVNHNQQQSAEHWQYFCAQQCLQRDIEFRSFSVSPKGSSEQLLRDARYQCFEQFLVAGDCLLLGHHANDQAETMLFRLVRGAGAKGLSAMPRHRSISSGYLLRPLLSISRPSLEQLAQQYALQWIEDPSNQSLEYDRNYIRKQVLSPLVAHWPKACEQMAVSAHLIDQERALLNQYLAEDLRALVIDNRFNLQAWKSLEKNKAISLLRFWVSEKTASPVSKNALNRILHEVVDARVDSLGYCPVGGYHIRRFKQHLYVLKAQQVLQPWPVLSVQSHRYALAQGVFELQNADTGIIFKEGMYLQVRVDGMTLTPVNRSRKKLVKVFQEHSVPPWLRDTWPLLMYDSEIVAVPGICICEGWQQLDKNRSLFWPQWQAL